MRKILTTLFGLGLFAVLLLPRGASALTVSPPYFDFALNPGDTVLDVIKVYNESDAETVTYYPVLLNFTADEAEGGSPEFYPADEDPMGTALAPWITVTDTGPITLGPKERANIQFAINIPTDRVQPGGHYGALLLSNEPPDPEGGTVGIASQVGVLILLRVSGEVREVGRIAEFGFRDPQVWYNYLPVDFFLRFENAGNTHLRPTGNLFIENWYGRQVAALKVNESFGSVLPNSIRRFTFGWQNFDLDKGVSELLKEWRNFALGKYKATLVLNYGFSNSVITDERVFYVWPWRLMTVFGVGVIAALILLTLLKHAYDISVIRSYEKRQKKKK